MENIKISFIMLFFVVSFSAINSSNISDETESQISQRIAIEKKLVLRELYNLAEIQLNLAKNKKNQMLQREKLNLETKVPPIIIGKKPIIGKYQTRCDHFCQKTQRKFGKYISSFMDTLYG